MKYGMQGIFSIHGGVIFVVCNRKTILATKTNMPLICIQDVWRRLESPLEQLIFYWPKEAIGLMFKMPRICNEPFIISKYKDTCKSAF